MPLADVTRLADAPVGGWRVLAGRLREIGFDSRYLNTLAGRLPGLPANLMNTGLRWLTLDANDLPAMATRLLLLGESLADDAVETLFGAALAQDAATAGLLIASRRGWAFALRLELVNDLFVVSDPPGDEPDTVMAVGGSTQLLARACYPQTDIGRALDVGCGSGTLALLLASACREVVATDIQPRALRLAKFNAGLNGIENIEFRQGHLFEPVANEAFDLVVAQPPFHALPDAAMRVFYLHGGRLGDELALELLAGASAHLGPGGLAIVLCDFPRVATALEARVHERVPADALLVLTPDNSTSLATHATFYGHFGHPGDASRAAKASQAVYAHLSSLGIDEMQQAIVVVQAGAAGSHTMAVQGERWASLHRSDIDRALAIGSLTRGSLFGQRLRLAPGCLVSYTGPAKAIGESVWGLDRAEGNWLGPLRVSEADWHVLQTILGSDSTDQALRSIDSGTSVSPTTWLAAAEDLVRGALLRGLACVEGPV